jgi:HSP20 family molecular chaperone IbpA
MKLKVSQNSIRLRLSQTEVKRLADRQTIEMRADLLPQPLVYQLAADEEGEPASVTFQDGILQVTLPASQLRHWALTEQVGIEISLPGGSASQPLSLLVEKDFKCLHGEVEDQEDCFANPLAAVK